MRLEAIAKDMAHIHHLKYKSQKFPNEIMIKKEVFLEIQNSPIS